MERERGLAFHAPLWPGFGFLARSQYVDTFFVGSLLCSEKLFLGYAGFLLSPKTNTWFDLS